MSGYVKKAAMEDANEEAKNITKAGGCSRLNRGKVTRLNSSNKYNVIDGFRVRMQADFIPDQKLIFQKLIKNMLLL